MLRHLDSLVRKSLVVADHTAARTRYSLFETIRQFAEDRLAEHGALEAPATVTPRTSGARPSTRWEGWEGPGWRAAVDWVEAELGNLRTAYRWSASRGDLEVATDVAAHAALMGFSVQLFETLAWAEELLEPATAADVRRLPRLYTAAGYACFAGRAEAARGERAPGHRAGAATRATTPCPPGYASFIEALGAVYCGDLDRYVELTARGRGSGTGASAATACRPTSTASSRPGGPRRRSHSPRSPSRWPGRSATRTGSRTRCGSRAWRSPTPSRAGRSRPGTRA